PVFRNTKKGKKSIKSANATTLEKLPFSILTLKNSIVSKSENSEIKYIPAKLQIIVTEKPISMSIAIFFLVIDFPGFQFFQIRMSSQVMLYGNYRYKSIFQRPFIRITGFSVFFIYKSSGWPEIIPASRALSFDKGFFPTVF